MWMLDNATPFAAAQTWSRGRDGAESLLVAVKASFIVDRDGVAALAPEQPEVARGPLFRGEPGSSSLRCECDLVPVKRATDVLVDGDAVAPRGIPTRAVAVRLRVATVDKTLRVSGDRAAGASLAAAKPFLRMPLVYERAFGGVDAGSDGTHWRSWEPRNPVGKGHAGLHGSPNIELAGSKHANAERGAPAGFGPIARHWAPRAILAGTYDDAWESGRKPLVPDDFDDAFYQCAPTDQQVDGFLKGGEVVDIEGMTPDKPWTFRLPRFSLAVTSVFYTAPRMVRHELPALHTLMLMPAQRGFYMVWHSALPCHSRVNELKTTRIALKRRVELGSNLPHDEPWHATSVREGSAP